MCAGSADEGARLIEERQAEVAERIRELKQFDAQLDAVRAELESKSAPQACRADLTCCVPQSAGVPVVSELQPLH